MRAYKKGFLDILGIVRIPVKVYSAIDKGIALSGMSKCCGSFVGYKKVCKKCGKELEQDEIGKGFWDGVELTPIDTEMLEQIKLPTIENIEIKGFVDKVDPVLYSGKVYFLGVDEKKDKRTKELIPDLTARKDYMMLAEALKRAGKIAIGKTVFRNKEEIVAISEYNGGLILNILYFMDQVRDYSEIFFDFKVDKEELKDSIALVKSMNNIKLDEFKDEYTEQLQRLIAGEKIEVKEVKKVEVNGNKWRVALQMTSA